MYADYLKEMGEFKTMYEDDYGFFIYSIQKDVFYVEEVYIKPEYRRKGVGKMFDEIAQKKAKELDCKSLRGSVLPYTNGATESMKFQLALGYQLDFCLNGVIYLKKDIGV